MIGFNGTYLPAASLGNMRITAAAIGGQMVMSPWHISPASQQAIIAAFGAEEGIAVISLTNDYLNAIAATDNGRAQQMTNFINEDPLLVCSLVETSKVRKLESDGVAYIDTGISADTPLMSFECLADMTGLTAYPKSLFGTIGRYGDGIGMYGVIYHGQGGIGFRVGTFDRNCVSTGLNAQSTNSHLLGIVGDSEFELFVDGVSKGTKAKGTPASKPMYLFGTWIDSNNSKTKSRIAFIRFFTDTDIANFIPFQLGKDWSADKVSTGVAQSAGANGMLDILSGTFYPNANTEGTFTIQLTDK